jgi:flavin reductase (DIM6/NTAB) family NADH-FMN oxidoreductase RutF
LTEYGSPVLEDALVTFFCDARDVLPGGDHSIFVGAVYDVREGTQGQPVLYHKRAYFGVGDHVSDHE